MEHEIGKEENYLSLCVANTLFKKRKNVTYSAEGNETEIDFVLVENDYQKYLKVVKVTQVTPRKLQHELIEADVYRRTLS